MKSQLILFNGISVAACLLWIGYKFVEGFARAMGSTSPGPDVGFVMAIVGGATAACVVGSFFAPANAAKFVSLAPLALIVLGQGTMSYLSDAHYKRREDARAVHRAARQKKVDGFSKDYVYKDGMGGGPGDSKSSFLTLDPTLQVIVRIDVSYESQMDAYPVGRVNGDQLETLEPLAEPFFRRYVDSEGKTVFDRYTLKHVPGQDTRAYQLEKYE